MQEAVSKGKRVLIASHENAIRGILMHLCGIPEEAMNKLHLPNGVPLVYNVKGKCISLLDDGSGIDPMEKYDFGPAAKYLFKPCELYDDFFDEVRSNFILIICFGLAFLSKTHAHCCSYSPSHTQRWKRKPHHRWRKASQYRSILCCTSQIISTKHV